MGLKWTFFILALLVPARAQESNRSKDDRLYEFDFKASPDQCSDVLYKEVATRIVKDAGGITPRTVRLAPKLYIFTCICPSGDVDSKPTMVGEAPGSTFYCKVVEALPKALPVKVRIQNGEKLYLILDKLTHNDGTIVAGGTYEVWYEQAISTWHASGPNIYGVAAAAAYGSGPGSPGNLPSPETPDKMQVDVWGHGFRFDERGIVFEENSAEEVGRIVF